MSEAAADAEHVQEQPPSQALPQPQQHGQMLGEQQQHQQDLEQQHTKTQQVNDQEDGEQHEQQCHICMHSMKEPSAVEGCGHKFCHSCIQQWVGSRQQPCCPVCRAEIKVLLLSDGSEQEAEPAAAPAPAEAEPDLSCLDHSYFLAEVSRLQSRAQSVHNRVYREAYGCGRKGGAHQTVQVLDGVQDVIDLLAGYRSTLEGEVRFDAQMLLSELYRLDRQLTSLQTGSNDSSSGAADVSSSGSTAAAAGDLLQQQQHAADMLAGLQVQDGHEHNHEHDYYGHEHDHEHDYDSADDFDWHEGLSRTPGRRPTQRTVVKHGRSNSGGNSQQQRQQQQAQPRQQLTPQERGPIPRWRQGQGQGRQRGSGNGPTGL